MIELPTIEGGFRVALIDPPWQWKTWGGDLGTPHRGAHDHYGVMPMEKIAEIPVGSVMAANSAMFMWYSGNHVEDALALGRGWGFEFVRSEVFVWIKANEGFQPRPSMGYYSRNGAELCMLFKRGSPKVQDHGVDQVIFCKRGPHSAKPERQYEAIERMFEPPYLEIFARNTRPGWSSFGNQVGIRDGLFV